MFIKRTLDLAISIAALLALSVLMIFIALCIYIRMGRPIFYTQIRAGQGGQPFKIIKFRTMRNEMTKDGVKLTNEERVTKLGKILRKYSLDELPQLFNIIKGDISIVGPRPLLMDYVPLYNGEQARRLEVKPGLTGWAQVNGRNTLTWEEKFALDVWYVNHQSLWLDLKIIILTFVKVIKSDGVNQSNEVIVQRFTGSKEV
ncbi:MULTISPECIES: sugar transferase [Paenibacillus]|uniref:Sugar transferase n=1 Tax=Paenibacillus residui TaxID=629724 RepID=A0ABW3D8Y8_9BACL|nr:MULTISPECIES: sugar transferase [Paenibacillaceae]